MPDQTETAATIKPCEAWHHASIYCELPAGHDGPHKRRTALCEHIWDDASTVQAPSAGRETLVHNHGPEEGPGLSCRERRIDGRLVGECLAGAAAPAAEGPLELLLSVADYCDGIANRPTNTGRDLRSLAARLAALTSEVARLRAARPVAPLDLDALERKARDAEKTFVDWKLPDDDDLGEAWDRWHAAQDALKTACYPDVILALLAAARLRAARPDEEGARGDPQCGCCTWNMDDVASAANRLCGAMTNGEQPTDDDFAAVRDWSAEFVWERSAGRTPGPHHGTHCPRYRAKYAATPSLSAREREGAND